jgi:hypothetical protein
MASFIGKETALLLAGSCAHLPAVQNQQREQSQTHHGGKRDNTTPTAGIIDFRFHPIFGAEVSAENHQTVAPDLEVMPDLSRPTINQDQRQSIDASGQGADDKQINNGHWAKPGAKCGHQFDIARPHPAKHVEANKKGEAGQGAEQAEYKPVPTPCDSVIDRPNNSSGIVSRLWTLNCRTSVIEATPTARRPTVIGTGSV